MHYNRSKIDVLLATFQGEKNLSAQINSILKQSIQDFRLLVRDDGSVDSTHAIIQSYAAETHGKLVFIEDESGRLGPSGSFSRLLTISSAEYIMFCDQDDLWLPRKIELSLEKMKQMERVVGKDTPILVHSDAKVVDQNLSLISGSLWRYQNIHPKKRQSLNRLLVQNIVTGCTVIINRPLRDRALPIPDTAIMHDWWLALVASAFGVIGYIEQPTMLYRQHHSNTIGAKVWSLSTVLKNLSGNNGQVRNGILNAQKQAYAFGELYDENLTDSQRWAVAAYASLNGRPYLEKLLLLFRWHLFKAGLIRNLGFWVHI